MQMAVLTESRWEEAAQVKDSVGGAEACFRAMVQVEGHPPGDVLREVSPQSAPGDTAACGRPSCLSVCRILTGGPAYPKVSQSSGPLGFTALTPHQPAQPRCVPLPGQVPLCPVDRKTQGEPLNQQQGSSTTLLGVHL